MSIHVISLVLRKRLGGLTRNMIAIKLADVANEDGTSIYPAVSTIATEAEMSERQVQRVLAQFRNEGPRVVIREGVGRRITSEYRFNMDAPYGLADAKLCDDASDGEDRLKGDTQSPFLAGKVRSVTEKCDKLCQPTRPYPSFSKSTASDESGAGAPSISSPSISSLVWKETLDLLRTHSTASEQNQRKLIGSWLKRTSSDADNEKLLVVVRAARRAGTADPESYITKAVKEWDRRLGPPPGKRGYLMPPHFITPELIGAINGVILPIEVVRLELWS